MTLSELINKLQEINCKVTSADFETNVLTVNANLEGDWKNWSVNIHTKDEEWRAEEGEELAYNCEKRGYRKGWKDCEEESTRQLEQVNQEWQHNMVLQKELLIKKIYEYMKTHSWYGTGWYTYYTAMIKEL